MTNRVDQRTSRVVTGQGMDWKVVLAALGLCLVAHGAEAQAEPSARATADASRPAVQATSDDWAERLKGQTIVEDAMEGHPERTSMVEQQHHRVMHKIEEQMTHDHEVQRTAGTNATGFYNGMSMMHQYGAGGGRTFSSCPTQAVNP